MGPWSCQKGSFLLLLRIVDDLCSIFVWLVRIGQYSAEIKLLPNLEPEGEKKSKY